MEVYIYLYIEIQHVVDSKSNGPYPVIFATFALKLENNHYRWLSTLTHSEVFIYGKMPERQRETVQCVTPNEKGTTKQDILLMHDGTKVLKEEVAPYLGDFFINIGKRMTPPDRQQTQCVMYWVTGT